MYVTKKIIGHEANLEKTQGLFFNGLAWLVVVACVYLPPLAQPKQLVVLTPLILLLGVPHGALDPIFVRQILHIQSNVAWVLFTLGYLSLASSVVVLWWCAPMLFLVLFLLVSIFHFSGDLVGNPPKIFRIFYGGAIILCPLALHSTQVSSLFEILVGANNANGFVLTLKWMAWPWAIAIGVVATLGIRQNTRCSAELLSVAALLIAAPPLLGFTVYFCCMHSARHILRVLNYSRQGTFKHLVAVAALPMLATLVAVAMGWHLLDELPIDTRITQILFVGLAALTIPHMIIVEQVRFSGWKLGRG